MRISDWSSDVCSSDLSDTWPHMTHNAKGVIGSEQTLKYQALTGHNKPEGWPGGGYVYDGFTKDDTQWMWWLAYRRMMLGENCKAAQSSQESEGKRSEEHTSELQSLLRNSNAVLCL